MPDWMTVGYLMSYLKPFYPAWDDARAAELVRQFDLPLDRKLKHLVAWHVDEDRACIFARLPAATDVLDEPFTGLDPLVRDELIEGVLDAAEGATILISSHDLAEIETFASHIGYLDRGRLQFSEEMTSLAARFREVEITFNAPPSIPARLPSTWLQIESLSTVVRFVETQFDAQRTSADIGGIFADVKAVSMNPIPLRTIFLTLAKAARKAA